MSKMMRGLWLTPDSWESFEGWVADCLGSLDLADVFEIGPANYRPSDEEEEAGVPCFQAMALADELVMVRLSQAPMGIPLLRSYDAGGVELDEWQDAAFFEDCTEGWIVSTNPALLAAACSTWFRDRNGLDFRELGCEHFEAQQLGVSR